MFAIPFAVVRSRAWLATVIGCLIASSVVPTLFAFIELGLGWGITEEDGLRIKSTFAHPNIFAFYLVAMIGLILYAKASSCLKFSSRIMKIITCYLPVLVVLLLLTKTRSAWVAAALLFVIYAGFFDRRYLLLGLLTPLILYIPGVEDRLADLSQGNTYGVDSKLNSYAWRSLMWESAFEWIFERLVTGYGLDSFIYFSPVFFPLAGDQAPGAHNVYVQLLFEAGLVGLSGFIWIFAAVGLALRHGFRQDPYGTLIIGGLILGFGAACYSDNMLHYLAFMWYFWFAVGAVCAVQRATQTLDQQSRPVLQPLR
jgi:O-antigen ligase